MSEFPKAYFNNLIDELKSIKVSDQKGKPVEVFEDDSGDSESSEGIIDHNPFASAITADVDEK